MIFGEMGWGLKMGLGGRLRLSIAITKACLLLSRVRFTVASAFAVASIADTAASISGSVSIRCAASALAMMASSFATVIAAGRGWPSAS